MPLLVHSVTHLSILSAGTGKHLLWANLLWFAGDTKTRRLGWKPTCGLSPVPSLCFMKMVSLSYSHPLPHVGRCHRENYSSLFTSSLFYPCKKDDCLFQLVSLCGTFPLTEISSRRISSLSLASRTSCSPSSFSCLPLHHNPPREGSPSTFSAPLCTLTLLFASRWLEWLI